MHEHDYTQFPELTNSQLQVLQMTSPHKQITEDFEAVVVKVHDGDTITLRAGFRDFDFPLRLLDIDAPEMSEGGKKAQSWLESKILGQTVQVIIDPFNRVGKYGRLLGKVMFHGMNIGLEMMYLGLVSAFGYKKEGAVPDVNKYIGVSAWE